MNRKWCSLVLAGALSLSLLTLPAAGAAAGDRDEAAAVLSGLNILSGYSDGLYHLSDSLTRAQFCKLAILAEGHGDQATGSAYRSLFSDVAGASWAAPYINLAHEEGLMAGKGDGTFGPDEAVTLEQAVTVCLRLLGYTEADIGPFWPEDYLEKGQKAGLLEGLSAAEGQGLDRGQAALLLYNLLRLPTAQGKTFGLGLGSSAVENVVVLDNDAEAADGTLHTAWVYAKGTLGWYEQSTKIDNTLVCRQGTLLLDKTGKVMGFLPDEGSYKTIGAEETTASSVTDSQGNRYAVSASTPVILDEEATTYSNLWYDLEDRELTLYYAESGGICLVSAAQAQKYEGTLLTGYYENAQPNAADPSSITLLGHTFPVAEEAVGLSGLSVGEKITVSLNGAGEVIRAWDASAKKATVTAVLESASRGTLAHVSGLALSGEITNSSRAEELEGCLVRINSSEPGKLSVTALSGGTSQSLDVKGQTLGSLPLSEKVKIYDQVGSAPVTEITLEDILVDQVSAKQIAYVGTDERGQVDLLLLKNVTGDAYTYGIYRLAKASDGQGGSGDNSQWQTVAIENADGTSSYCATTRTLRETFGGLALTAEGEIQGFQSLTKVTDVSRSSFDGEDYVMLEGFRVPIADGVQVYNEDTDTWIDLETAKGYSSTMTAYYSGALGGDAKVRVVVVGDTD